MKQILLLFLYFFPELTKNNEQVTFFFHYFIIFIFDISFYFILKQFLLNNKSLLKKQQWWWQYSVSGYMFVFTWIMTINLYLDCEYCTLILFYRPCNVLLISSLHLRDWGFFLLLLICNTTWNYRPFFWQKTFFKLKYCRIFFLLICGLYIIFITIWNV